MFFIALKTYGIYGIFLGMALESMGVPGAGAVLDLLAGPLFKEYGYHPFFIILVANSGLTLGSAISYLVGKSFLNRVEGFLERRGRKEEYIKAREIANKYGNAGIFLSQLYGTTRTYISYPAGLLGLPFKEFLLFTFLGGAVYCSLITLLSIYAYAFLKELYRTYASSIWFPVILGFISFAILAFFAAKYTGKKLFKK
jgi:membrane protein DedA with SNARE-associated domain